MSEACDLCGCAALEELYIPRGRGGNEVVTICPGCSLLQTLPRPRRAKHKNPRLSSGADFGNLRYHKGLMSGRALGFLRRWVAPNSVRAALDIGANRGHLVRGLEEWLSEGQNHHRGGMRIVAVEPDHTVVDWHRPSSRVRLVLGRFEDVQLPGERFDLITCFHTLEHVDRPRAFLEKIAGLLSAQGKLFVEVPDCASIRGCGVVEEFFIDKHLYHFSRATLDAYLKVAGFRPIVWREAEDSSISVLAEPASQTVRAKALFSALSREAPAVRHMVAQYEGRLSRNLEGLSHLGAFIRESGSRRILLWGAGRIFDAFIGACGPIGYPVVGLVDSFVAALEVAGLPVLRPDAAKSLAPDLVIVFSRDYFSQIEAEARRLFGAGVEVSRYDWLMRTGAASPECARSAEPAGSSA